MKKTIRKKRLIILSLIIIIILLCVFIILLLNQNSKKNAGLKPVSLFAKTAIEKYENINFGEPVELKENSITTGGSYLLTGEYECLTINTIGNVQLRLEEAEITCTTGPAIYVEDSNLVNIHVIGKNTIKSTTTVDLDAAIYTKDNLIFTGEGSLDVTSNYDGITSKDSLMFQNGTYNLVTDGDAIKGRDNVIIKDGVYTINSKLDGIKSTNDKKVAKGYIVIDNGRFDITSESDAIQAETNLIINDGTFHINTTGDANKLSAKGLKGLNLLQIKDGYFEINTIDDALHSDHQMLIQGGKYTIKCYDDALHSDGVLQIDDGEISLTAKEGFETTKMIINSGTFTINASEHGLTAGNKHPKYKEGIEINGGDFSITMGLGDTCAIDSGDYITINDGIIRITTEEDSFFYSGKASFNGGTLIINGRKQTIIPEMEVIERVEALPGQQQQQPPQQPQNQ